MIKANTHFKGLYDEIIMHFDTYNKNYPDLHARTMQMRAMKTTDDALWAVIQDLVEHSLPKLRLGVRRGATVQLESLAQAKLEKQLQDLKEAAGNMQPLWTSTDLVTALKVASTAVGYWPGNTGLAHLL
jgi:hypothetical protein